MSYQKASDIIKARRQRAEAQAAMRREIALNDSRFYQAEKKLRASNLALLKSNTKANENNVKKCQKERDVAL
ncbi:MAG: hypothetical protein FWC80_04795, partial [Firmicutes bacterium]|nr:hypothetical protein [Bacillota bacterium]